MEELVKAAQDLITAINENQANLYHPDLSGTVNCIILEKGEVYNSDEDEDDFDEYEGIEDKVQALEKILEEIKSKS